MKHESRQSFRMGISILHIIVQGGLILRLLDMEADIRFKPDTTTLWDVYRLVFYVGMMFAAYAVQVSAMKLAERRHHYDK